METKEPSCLLSVVTVNFNNRVGLEATLDSVRTVLGASGAGIDYEQIVVDGFSSDGSVEFLKSRLAVDARLRAHIDLDDGIYDAMNKGLRAAVGDWIYFLNSGDQVCDAGQWRILSELLSEETRAVSFCTSQTFRGDSYLRGGKESQLTRCELIAHQGIVVPRHAYSGSRFRLDLGISADSSWICDVVRIAGVVPFKSVLAVFSLGGVSNRPTRRSLALAWSEGRSHFFKQAFKWLVMRLLGERWAYRLFYLNKYERT